MHTYIASRALIYAGPSSWSLGPSGCPGPGHRPDPGLGSMFENRFPDHPTNKYHDIVTHVRLVWELGVSGSPGLRTIS